MPWSISRRWLLWDGLAFVDYYGMCPLPQGGAAQEGCGGREALPGEDGPRPGTWAPHRGSRLAARLQGRLVPLAAGKGEKEEAALHGDGTSCEMREALKRRSQYICLEAKNSQSVRHRARSRQLCKRAVLASAAGQDPPWAACLGARLGRGRGCRCLPRDGSGPLMALCGCAELWLPLS